MTVVADRAPYSIVDTMTLPTMSRSVIDEQIRAGRPKPHTADRAPRTSQLRHGYRRHSLLASRGRRQPR